jgi:predicted Fe-Mo cluster-binding NifX family protein
MLLKSILQPSFYSLLLVIFLCSSIVRSQSNDTLSGIINTYHKARITSLCNGTIVVPNAGANFSVGQRFVMIQMQGAVVDTSVLNYGNVLDYNGVGWYEVNAVRSLRGDTIECEYVFTNEYSNSDNSLQIIPIINYSSVTILDSITAKPWDLNNLGGVVVLFADSIFLQGKITVEKKGFWGGDSSSMRDSCNVAFLGIPAMNRGISGQKGQGIATQDLNHRAGIGAFATAAGAGVAHNSGGGGGSNKTRGGNGGRQYGNFCDSTLMNGGLGGKETTNTTEPQRIFMGGGGGGGHQNNRLATKGGIGGGIIICQANYIQSSPNSVLSAAGETPPIGGNDGGGGGGAGGSIVATFTTVENTLIYDVRGGNGSTLRNAQHGAGGGASGGVIVSNDTLNPAINFLYDGGAGGIAGVDNAANALHKGKNGENGILLQSIMNVAPKQRRTSSLSLDTLVPFNICKGDTVTISFSDNDVTSLNLLTSNQVITPTSPFRYEIPIDTLTLFTVVYEYDYSCVDTFQFSIGAYPLPSTQLTLSNDTVICVNDSITITAVDVNATYLWNTGDTTRSITTSVSGKYSVTVENAFGCSLQSDTISVTIYPYELPTFTTAKQVYICADSSIEIAVANTNQFVSYRWNTNDTTSSIRVSTPGKYTVQAVNQNGCLLFADTVEVLNFSVQIASETELLFDSVDIVTEKILTITLSNIGTDAFSYSARLLRENQFGFTLLNPNPTLVLQPTQSEELEVRFFPVRQLEYTDSLEIAILTPCPQTIYIPIQGFGRGHFITKISLPDTMLSVFDKNVTIPLTVELSPNYPTPFSTLEYSVEFAGGVFVPNENQNGQYQLTKQNALSSLFIEHTQPLQFGTTLTIPIVGDVLLGENEVNAISITNAGWKNTAVNFIDSIDIKNGSIQLTELCFEGGTRLLKAFNTSFSLTALSNVVDDNVDVVVDCKEVGEYKLRVFSLQGIEVYQTQFTHSLSEKTQKLLSIPLREFANGLYFIQCSSPTQIDRIRVMKQ